MPGDQCTAPKIISLSLFSLATDVTDATLGASGIWLGTRTGAGGTTYHHTSLKLFLAAAPMAPWTTDRSSISLICINDPCHYF